MKLAQKTIIVTGSSSGIGEAFAKEFAKRGARLVLVALDQDKTQQVVDTLEGEGHLAFGVDFTDPEQIIDFSEKLTDQIDKIDILVNNAGIGIYKHIEEIDPKEWYDSFAINVHSPFMLVKLFLPYLKKSQDEGLIINTGSQCGIEACYPRVAYNTTKFALRGLSLTLSKEFENTNLKSVYLALSSVMTNFGPMSMDERKKLQELGKKYYSPEEVAIFLADKIEGNDLPNEIRLIQ